MRLPGTGLVEMSDNSVPSGKSYFVWPHGRVDNEDAMKIIARPGVYEYDAGLPLLPARPQSWRIG